MQNPDVDTNALNQDGNYDEDKDDDVIRRSDEGKENDFITGSEAG